MTSLHLNLPLSSSFSSLLSLLPSSSSFPTSFPSSSSTSSLFLPSPSLDHDPQNPNFPLKKIRQLKKVKESVNERMSQNMKFRDSTKECLISLKDFLQKKECKIKKQMQEAQDLYLKEKDRGTASFLELVLDKEKRKMFLRDFRRKVENLRQMLLEWRGESSKNKNWNSEDAKWNGILEFQKVKEELMRKLIKVKAKILEKEEQSLMISEEILGGQLRTQEYFEELKILAEKLQKMRKQCCIKGKDRKNESRIKEDEQLGMEDGLEMELEKARNNDIEIKRKIESLDGYLNRLKFDLDDKRNEKIEIFNELTDEKEGEGNKDDSPIKLCELTNIFNFSYVSQNFPQKIENLQFFINLQEKVLKYLNSKGNEIEITILKNEILDWFKTTSQYSEDCVFNMCVFFKQVEFDVNKREECFMIFKRKSEIFKRKAEICIEIYELSNTFEAVSKQYFNFFLEKKKIGILIGLLEDKILHRNLYADFYEHEEADPEYENEKERLRKEVDSINKKIEKTYKLFEDELKRVEDYVLFDYITIYNKLKNKINELFNNELNYHLKLIEDSESDTKNDKKTQIYKLEILKLNKEIIGLFSFLLKNDSKPSENINELSKNDKLKLLENKIIILNSQLIEVKAMDYQEINKIEVKTHRFENLVQENQSQLKSIDNYINNIKKEENLTTTQLTEKSFIDEPQRRNSKRRLNNLNREICKVFPPTQAQEDPTDENKENSNNLNTKHNLEGKDKTINAKFQDFTQKKTLNQGKPNYFLGDCSISKRRGSLAHNELHNNYTNLINLNNQNTTSNKILEKIYKKRRTQSFCSGQNQNSSFINFIGDKAKADKGEKIERIRKNSGSVTCNMIKFENIQKNGREEDLSKTQIYSKNPNHFSIVVTKSDNNSKNDRLNLMKEFEKSLVEKGVDVYRLQLDERDINNSVFQARVLFLKKKERKLEFFKVYENFGKKKSILEGSFHLDHTNSIQIFHKKAMNFKNKEVLMVNNDYKKRIVIDKFLKLKVKGGMMELVGKNDIETIGLKKVLESLMNDSFRN